MNTICFAIIYLLLYLILSISGKDNKTINKLNVNIEYGFNNTFILYYNLTTNYSYYVTFRLFEHKQLKFGLFYSTSQYQQNSIQIFNQFNSSTEKSYLFIICFYFLRQFNDIDIQCKDIRLLKPNKIKSAIEFLPSYKPLFIPMMYILIGLMLVPMIIKRRHLKQIQKLERRKELRRLSITIAQDNPNILPRNWSLKPIPIQIELISVPSAKTMFDVIDDNDVTFTLQKLQPFIENYIEEESNISADDCIAHLLDSAPWKSTSIHHPPMISSISAKVLTEQHIPMMTRFYGNDDERRSSPHCKLNLLKSYSAFLETDV